MSDSSSVASERNDSVRWSGEQRKILDTFQDRWNDAPDSREIRRGFVTELVTALLQLEHSPPEKDLSKVCHPNNLSTSFPLLITR